MHASVLFICYSFIYSGMYVSECESVCGCICIYGV